MISRAQRILFGAMLVAVVAMSAILIRLRERAQERLHTVQGSTQIIETTNSSAPQTVTLVIPNDLDGSLQEVQRSMSLPADDSTKARVLLEMLLESFHDPHSTHYIPSVPSAADASLASAAENNAGVDEVFLMSIPSGGTSADSGKGTNEDSTKGTLAVVDLSAGFAASQPSGIEPETLTLLSIIGTLHANIPSITEVQFLIDGHPAETLAGHADLTRTYLTTDTTAGVAQP
ncbi:MAG TPA: GerMN domain-containing protein [Acidobacteriaceae bacterium]|nr:GerMN domain-containing protein [Acidobacteriaceae bacterium]